MTSRRTLANNVSHPIIPKLRFPKFRGASPWSLEALGSLGQFTRGLTYGADDVVSKGLLVLRSSNIQEGRLVLDRDLVFVKKPCPDGLRLQKGDIAICMSNGSKALVGKSAEFDGNYAGELTVGAFCSFFRPAVFFATLAFKTEKYERYVGDLIAGGNINNLSNSALEAFELPIPPTEPEQQKITECLNTLDKLIGAESQKLDALKSHKKGLMQQLFPREGETLPRLRLPGFQSGPAWKAKKLGSIADVLMCKRIFANETSDRGDVPFYKIGTLGGVADAYISSDQFETYKTRYNFPRVGEILVTCSGTVGKCIAYDGRDAYYQDSNIVWIDNPTHEVSNELLLSILSSASWVALNSTTITRIYGPDLKNLLIRFPQDSEEQGRIASCLASLQQIVVAQVEKVEVLKSHKRGLMQQLFPPNSAIAHG